MHSEQLFCMGGEGSDGLQSSVHHPSSVPTLPELETATYRGHASGLYTFYYGLGWQLLSLPEGVEVPVDGTRETSVYTGDCLVSIWLLASVAKLVRDSGSI